MAKQPPPPGDEFIEDITSSLKISTSSGKQGAIQSKTADNFGLPEDFEVRQEIGRGAMGMVLKAWQKSLQRYVAIKLLPENLATNKFRRDLFLREAQLCAGLRHPNIVQIYQIGPIGQGGFYFAMELVEGETLDKILAKTGPFISRRSRMYSRTLAQAFKLIFELCDALELAHEKGVIHRDIKPANIILDSDGRARLMDFGIAVLRQESAEGQTFSAGTPSYMAPEQARGDPCDQRADIYSLGCVFFFLLTGKPPYKWKSLDHLIRETREEGTLPQESQDLLPKEMPRGLKSALMKMMAYSPDKRYGDVRDTRRALEHVYLTQTDVGQARKTMREARFWIIFLSFSAALTVLIALGFILVKYTSTRAREYNSVTLKEVDALVNRIDTLIEHPLLTESDKNLYIKYLGDIKILHSQGNNTKALEIARETIHDYDVKRLRLTMQELSGISDRIALPPEIKDEIVVLKKEVSEPTVQISDEELSVLQSKIDLVTNQVHAFLIQPRF